MKGMLVRPGYSHVYSSFKLGKTNLVLPPLGYLYLAAYLEVDGHKITIIDGEAESLSGQQLIARILENNPEFVGIGATTPEFIDNNNILRRIKELAPHVITIAGGFHPSALPEETMRENPHIDYLVRGEGEQTLLELINTLEGGCSIKNVAGLTYRETERIMHNEEREPIQNLDKIPFPARHLIDNSKYMAPGSKRGLVPATTMLTSRGCPYQCIFCYRSKDRSKMRFRDPIKVADEIEEVTTKYNIQFIIFNDDTLTLRRDNVMQLCNEIIKRELDIQYFCLARADTLDRELIIKMKEAGMVNISMGIESGNQKILDLIKKGTTIEQYRAACKLALELNVETRGSFMIGLPYESRETIRDTINLAKSLDLTKAFFNITTPYPGSVLYDMALQGDGLRLLTRDWKEYKRWGNAVIELDGISRQDLIKLQRSAMLEYYLRPKIILHYLKYIVKKGHDPFYYRPHILATIKSIFTR